MTVRRTIIDCCNGCTERQADPNCHGFCKRYLIQKAELDESNAEIKRIQNIETNLNMQKAERVKRMVKRSNTSVRYNEQM
jgi:hypothetical protein